jgi:DNA-binding LacI/PurR family transcriptional regulator
VTVLTEESFGSRERVTMDDVARRAGVSRALVSIVMRAAPGASEEKRLRVLEAAAELGYRPDVRAQSLAGQRSRVIGVMFGVTVGAFHFELLDGLFTAAESHGHNLILSPLTRSRDEGTAARSLQGFRFDALIMLSPPTSHPLLAGRIPLAVVGWRVDHPLVDTVRTDDDRGIQAAVDHLVALGHRDIAHIDGGDTMIADARRSAYLTAMERHGLTELACVVPGGQSQVDGLDGARRLCSGPRAPTALVAYNDDIAVAAIGVFAQHGIAVPEGISVVGYDDSSMADLSPVPLTTVVQRPDELGRLAVERMVARVEQRRIVEREIVLEPELRIRSSTAPPSAAVERSTTYSTH